MLGLIWAQARDGVIGRDNDMPWHVPEDLAHFVEVTRGHPVVMGRRTWDSLQVQPLPGRLNVVVSRSPINLPQGTVLAHSLEDALETARVAAQSGDVWVIGGAQLYRSLIDSADRIELTELDLTVEGDTFAPPIGSEWTRTEGEWMTSREGVRYRFVTCTRP